MWDKKYWIQWYAKFTGESGHGTELFPFEQAKAIAKQLNDSESGVYCVFWAQLAKPEKAVEGDYEMGKRTG